MTLSEVKPGDDATRFTVGSAALGAARPSARCTSSTRRTRRSKGGEPGRAISTRRRNWSYEAKTKEKTVTIEFELWQNLRDGQGAVQRAGRARHRGGRADADRNGRRAGVSRQDGQAAGQRRRKPPGPPPVDHRRRRRLISRGGRQADADRRPCGKGAQVLAVIYPTERTTYAQAVAMAMAFLPMASMGDEKAGAAIQKELDAFFDKHKITPPMMREPDELFKGVDVNAFVSDAMVFMKAHTKKGDRRRSCRCRRVSLRT